jgi:hypothetical protein
MPTLTPPPKRNRNSRQALGFDVELTPLKLSILKKLNDYYDLPTSFICALHPESASQYVGRVLTKMFHEEKKYLDRDPMYGDYFSKQEVYKLGDGGKDASKQLGFSAYTLGAGMQKYHEKMLIACSASLEIACKQNGLTFHTTTDIINRPHTPAIAKTAKNPRRVKLDDKRVLIMDDLFSIGYPDGYLYYNLEADTGTEQLEKRPKYSSIEQKMEYSKELYARKLYKSFYGLNSLLTLFVTVSEVRMRHMMELAVKTGLGTSAIFTFLPEYAKKTHPYKPAPQLLTQPWYRGNGQSFNLLTGK